MTVTQDGKAIQGTVRKRTREEIKARRRLARALWKANAKGPNAQGYDAIYGFRGNLKKRGES